MKFYPYSNLQSNNLKPILFLARTTCVLGFLLFIAAILSLIASPFLGSEVLLLDHGMKMTTADNSWLSVLAAISFFVGAIFVVGLSGLFALAVSFEHKNSINKVDQNG